MTCSSAGAPATCRSSTPSPASTGPKRRSTARPCWCAPRTRRRTRSRPGRPTPSTAAAWRRRTPSARITASSSSRTPRPLLPSPWSLCGSFPRPRLPQPEPQPAPQPPGARRQLRLPRHPKGAPPHPTCPRGLCSHSWEVSSPASYAPPLCGRARPCGACRASHRSPRRASPWERAAGTGRSRPCRRCRGCGRRRAARCP
mmetsp:Transcript_87161/g.282242  ORF Transcript_87161/g.282242 Transcript_87161/m.282242 type:complete len:200 (+) Transcript_87161:178-777(+)